MLVDGRELAVAGRLLPTESLQTTDPISREPFSFRDARPRCGRRSPERVYSCRTRASVVSYEPVTAVEATHSKSVAATGRPY